MKIRTLIILILGITFASCGEDRRKEYAPRVEVNKWIENTMRYHYYWNEKMPESNKLNYFTVPEVFFPTLLVSEDGRSGNRFSTIEEIEEVKTRIIGDNESYGFEFTLKSSIVSSQYYAQVLYVLKDSPAEKAGLKRGDWIVKVNNTPLTSHNYSNLLYKGGAAEIELGEYDEETERFIPSGNTINMGASVQTIENPVYYYNTYPTTNGKVAGYLVYNHFVSGTSSNDETFLNEIVKVSNEFKAAGVTHVIVDLRYNPGGTIPPALLLCSMLVPEESLSDKVMCFIEYNENNASLNEYVRINQSTLKGASNLNPEKVYFLVTGATASASELLINSLTPYLGKENVVLIGEKTLGKNVGTKKIIDPESNYPWAISPVVCRIYNANNESDYSQGFNPTYSLNELKDNFLHELGDPQETLLKAAIGNIEGTYPEPEEPEEETRATQTKSTPAYCSLERKAIPGVIIE